MNNVISVSGTENLPEERCIGDMTPGEMGYAVPWAFDFEEGHLKEDFPISSKGGTASMQVRCVAEGQYAIQFEKPTYRSLREVLYEG